MPHPAVAVTAQDEILGPAITGGYEGRMIRVFLLDDHEVVRRGLADLLRAAG